MDSDLNSIKHVVMLPKNHEYINLLCRKLKNKGITTQCIKPFHWATADNIIKMIICSRNNYRIIHVHWMYVFPLFTIMKCFWILCKVLNYKIVWEMHNILPHGYNESDRKKSKWFFEHVDGIIYHNKSDIERAKKMLSLQKEKPYTIVPHGNFNESFSNTRNKNEAKKILNLNKYKNVILCFGFIRRNRGYETLLEAAKEMKDIGVVIAGKKEHADIYDKIIQGKKKMANLHLFEGYIPDDELQLYFKACDIVVLPYTEITTSGVIPLAYSFKRPVIASNIGGIKDVVNDKTGVLIEPGNKDHLIRAINEILSKDFKKMGIDAFQFSKEEFNWDKICHRIAKLYSEL